MFSDPIGNRLEVFHGGRDRARAVQSGPLAFPASAPGRSAWAMRCSRSSGSTTSLPFYRDVLGFRLSDYILQPFKAYFFHVNPRHHSLAFLETGKNGIHHLMVELFCLDDVGQAYDFALRKPDSIGTDPRPSHQRSRDLVLFVVAVEISWSNMAGAAAHRPGNWTAAGTRRRPEPVGP